METVLIDTNFILTATKQKMHLFEQLREVFGVYTLIVPKQILGELNKISKDKRLKVTDRNAAKISIQIINLQKPKIIDLKTIDADAGIARYSKGKTSLYIATLDKNLKKKIKQKNPKVKFLTIRQKTRVGEL